MIRAPDVYGEQERYLHRDTIVPIPTIVGKNFAPEYIFFPPSNGMDDHSCITDDDCLRDFRDWRSCWSLLPVLLPNLSP